MHRYVHSFLIDAGGRARKASQALTEHGWGWTDGAARRAGGGILCNVTPTKNHFAVARSTAAEDRYSGHVNGGIFLRDKVR